MKITMSVRSQSGATLVEAMITMLVLAIISVGILPIFFSVKKEAKFGSVKQLCQKTVQSKLDEYRGGHFVNSDDLSSPAMRRLSFPNFATTSTAGLNGFFYAKYRYNRYFNEGICNGTSQARILTTTGDWIQPAPPSTDRFYTWAGTAAQWRLGMRECVGNNAIAPDGDPSTLVCDTGIDRSIGAEIPGFKMYVRIELDTTWPGPPGPVAPLSGAYHPYCPDQRAVPLIGAMQAGATFPPYDFGGYGENIRITVTGVMDYPSVGTAVRNIAGIKDAGRLMCSASGTVAPDPFPFRYYLSRSGRIYSASGGGRTAAGTRDPETARVFDSVYAQGGQSAMGIRSIAVHPRGYALYILKAGRLIRYGLCSGMPIDCRMANIPGGGLADNGATGIDSVKEWGVLPSISQIAVDFRNMRIYGLTGDRSATYLLECPPELENCSAASVDSMPTTDVEFIRRLDLLPRRLTGFFVSPGGDAVYASDRSESNLFGSKSYNSTIYRAEMVNPISAGDVAPTLFPIITVPLDAVGFSM